MKMRATVWTRHAGLACRSVLASLTRFWLKLRYRLLSRRYRRLVLEIVDGVPLVVLPEVFNPVLLRSGATMARTLSRLPARDAPRLSVLDLGTGSGIGAVSRLGGLGRWSRWTSIPKRCAARGSTRS